ncbi:MAG: YceD family protein [Acidimicrobiales bacterium]
MPGRRTAFTVGVTDELRRPGTQRPVHIAAQIPGLSVSSARVPDDADVDVDVVLESTADGRVTATGSVRAPWVGECRRCLRLVEGMAEAHVQEVFERNAVDDETYPLDHDQVDLEPVARDAVMLALPLAPLCRPDCVGSDPEHHPVHAGDEPAPEPEQDPRWAPLRDLKLD